MGKALLISQTGYVVVMGVALAFTVAGMFTPGWRRFENLKIDDDNIKSLFELHCPKTVPKCNWWKDMPTWTQVVFIAISFAIILQFLGIVWGVLAFVLTAHRKIQMFILIGISAVVCFLIAIVLTNFATNDIETYDRIVDGQLTVTVGYSYWLTCAAFLFSFATILFGIVAARTANKEHSETIYHW